ncbi:MAG: LLM class flavin-dependent oxidoreductase [Rhizobiales bacterium]|nr:LLM class flavin-dependent oxidoreductase [Hyphomicrobiales bacterium]
MVHARRQMRLGAFFHPTGHHTAAWRHPDAQADAGISFEHYKEITQLAERAKFDMVFLADNLSVREGRLEALCRSAVYIANIEPMVFICALAGVTSRIGLVSTASTSYHEYLSLLLKTDLIDVPLDGHLPDLALPQNASWQFFNWVDLARRENLTVRQLALRAAVGRVNMIKGSPDQIADYMQHWFEQEACDGFNIMPPYLPGAFADFVELVIPGLQRRCLFRSEYE